MITADALRTRTCKDLGALARKSGVSGWHAMRKDQLVRALLRLSGKQQGVSKNGRPAAGQNAHHLAPATHRNGLSGGGNGVSTRRVPQVRQLSRDLASKPRRGQVKDRLVVMVRDSYWLHVCWELRRQSVERAAAALAQHWHTAHPVLRVMEVSSDGTTNTTERVLRDVEIHGGVNNWYLHVENPPSTFRVAIGYRAESGQFYGIARSNVVTTPSPDASDDLDRNWDDVARNFDKIFAMSGGYEGESHAGDLQELFEERLRRPMGSPMMTRFGVGVGRTLRDGSRFHFEVDAEIIVYGMANPDSRVTLRGQPVHLREDGSFTVRLSLPDRRQVIPVVANSANGVEQRTIVVAVERNTKIMETLIREPEEPLGT